jgi:hypothetical protein
MTQPPFPQPQQPFGQQPPPEQPKRKKKHRARRVVIILCSLVAVVIGIAAANSDSGTHPGDTRATGVVSGNEAGAPVATSQEQSQVDDSTQTITYEVTGSGGAKKVDDIRYTTDGVMTQNGEKDVTLPWKKEIKLPKDEPLQAASMTVFNFEGKGKLTATISVNGKVVKTAEGVTSVIISQNIGTLGN